MSVIVTLRAKGDVAAFERYASEHGDQLLRITEDAKKRGAKHHLFAAGDGEIVVIDEWPNPEAFQGFFTSHREIPEVMAAAGVQGQPEITFARKIDTVDEF